MGKHLYFQTSFSVLLFKSFSYLSDFSVWTLTDFFCFCFVDVPTSSDFCSKKYELSFENDNSGFT